MCTITLALAQFETAPVLVGANREERYDRPARPPALRETEPRIVAPRDLAAGGTWIGMNERRLCGALTNRPNGPSPGRSRGQLLNDVLQATHVEGALETVRTALSEDPYAGFHLVVATPEAARLVTWDGEHHVRALDPGLHAITNGGHHAVDAKAAAARTRLLSATDGDVASYRSRLRTVLADHALPTCVHDDADRGTRSSSLVTLQADGDVRWSFADGPPCNTTYRTVHNGNFKRDSPHTHG